MRENLSLVKPLGTLKAIEYLMALLEVGAYYSIESIKSGTHAAFKSPELFQNSVDFLFRLGFFEISHGKLKYKEAYSNQVFRNKIFSYLDNAGILHQFLPVLSIKFAPENNQILIRNCMIPVSFSPIRNLLINLGVFQKNTLSRDIFYIKPDLHEWFLKEVIPLVERSESRFTLENLKKLNAKNQEVGEEAEVFVLGFEQKKLVAHSRVKDICQISNESASAGYDIKSFLSLNSICLDKEIEVKSYSGDKPYFYWSRSEFEQAKLSKGRYYLYLVNRDLLLDKDYCPEMIKNPYEKLMNSPLWEVKIENYFFKLK